MNGSLLEKMYAINQGTSPAQPVQQPNSSLLAKMKTIAMSTPPPVAESLTTQLPTEEPRFQNILGGVQQAPVQTGERKEFMETPEYMTLPEKAELFKQEMFVEPTRQRLESIGKYSGKVADIVKDKGGDLALAQMATSPTESEFLSTPETREMTAKISAEAPNPLPIETYATAKLIKAGGFPIPIVNLAGKFIPKKIIEMYGKNVQDKVSPIGTNVSGMINTYAGSGELAKHVLNAGAAGINKLAEHSPYLTKTLAGFEIWQNINPVAKIAGIDIAPIQAAKFAAERGTTYAIASLAKETSEIFADKEKLDIGKRSARFALNTALGTTLGPIHALQNVPAKAILASMDVTAWKFLNDKINRGYWIPTRKDVPDYLVNAGLRMVIETIGSSQLHNYWKRQDMQNYLDAKAQHYHTEGIKTSSEYRAAVAIGQEFKPGGRWEIPQSLEKPAYMLALKETPTELFAYPKAVIDKALGEVVKYASDGILPSQAIEKAIVSLPPISTQEAEKNVEENIKKVENKFKEITKTEELDLSLYEQKLTKVNKKNIYKQYMHNINKPGTKIADMDVINQGEFNINQTLKRTLRENKITEDKLGDVFNTTFGRPLDYNSLKDKLQALQFIKDGMKKSIYIPQELFEYQDPNLLEEKLRKNKKAKPAPKTKMQLSTYEEQLAPPAPPPPSQPLTPENVPPPKRLHTVSDYIAVQAGTLEEAMKTEFGRDRGQKVYRTMRQVARAKNLAKSELEKRNLAILGKIPKNIREKVFDVLEGIHEKNPDGSIKFGTYRRHGVMPIKAARELGKDQGDTLDDGRYIGAINPDNKKEFLLHRHYDTEDKYNQLINEHPETKDIIDKYLADEEEIVQTKYKDILPSFAHKVTEKQFNIKRTDIPFESKVYLPSVTQDPKSLARTGRLLKLKLLTPSGLKFNEGILAELGIQNRDMLTALTAKQSELLEKTMVNKATAEVLSLILEPMEGYGKIKEGYTQADSKIIKLMEANKEIFASQGLDIEESKLYQFPDSLRKYVGIFTKTPYTGEIAKTHNKVSQAFKNMVSYQSVNYLLRPSSANRNFIAGMIQYQLGGLTKMYDSVLSQQGFRPAIEHYKALFSAFTPEVRARLPEHVLGETYHQGLTDKSSKMQKAFGASLAHWNAIENYFKRASFEADLNTAAYKAMSLVNVPSSQKKQFLLDFKENFFLDLFNWISDNSDAITYDYKNSPNLITRFIPKVIAPYVKYPYNKMRMYLEYSPLGLLHEGKAKAQIGAGYDKATGKFTVKETPNTLTNKISKMLAGMTMWALAVPAVMKIVKRHKEDLEKFEMDRIPFEFDTTGRIKVYGDAKHESWLRVYDWPIIGDLTYLAEISQGNADIDSWVQDSISLGPTFMAGLAIYGFRRRKWDRNKETSTMLGEITASTIPFGAWVKYARILKDKNKRKVYSKDFNAFQNFINPILNAVPGTSELLPTSEIGDTGVARQYDLSAETAKMFFLNLQSIDKYEAMQFINDDIATGNRERRHQRKLWHKYGT